MFSSRNVFGGLSKFGSGKRLVVENEQQVVVAGDLDSQTVAMNEVDIMNLYGSIQTVQTAVDGVEAKTQNVLSTTSNGETKLSGVVECSDIKTDFVPTGLEDFAKSMIQANTGHDTQLSTLSGEIDTVNSNLATTNSTVASVQSSVDNLESGVQVASNKVDISKNVCVPTMYLDKYIENEGSLSSSHTFNTPIQSTSVPTTILTKLTTGSTPIKIVSIDIPKTHWQNDANVQERNVRVWNADTNQLLFTESMSFDYSANPNNTLTLTEGLFVPKDTSVLVGTYIHPSDVYSQLDDSSLSVSSVWSEIDQGNTIEAQNTYDPNNNQVVEGYFAVVSYNPYTLIGVENISSESFKEIDTKIQEQKNDNDNLQGQITVLDSALTSAMTDFPTLSQQQNVENQLQSINYFLQSLNFSSAGQNLLQATAMDSVLNVDSSKNTIILGHCNQDGKPSRMVLHGECSGTPNGSNFDNTTDSELWFSRGYNITEPHQWEESTLQQSYRFGHNIVSSSQKFGLTEKLTGNTGGDDGSDEKKLMLFSTNELTGFNNRFSVYTDNVSLAGHKIFLGTAVESLQERLRKLERQISGYEYTPVQDEDSQHLIIPPYVGWTSNQVTVDSITYEAGGSVNSYDGRHAFSTANDPYIGSATYNDSFGSYTGISRKINGNLGDWLWIKMNKKVEIGSIKVGTGSNFRSWKLYKETNSTTENSSEIFNAELLLEIENSGANAQKGCGYYSFKRTTVEANERLIIQVNTIMAGSIPSSLTAKDIFFEGKFLE